MAKINALKLKSALTKYGEQIKTDPENALFHLTEAGYSEDESAQIIAKVNEGAVEVAKPSPKVEKAATPAKKETSLTHATYEKWNVERQTYIDEDGKQKWKIENKEFVFTKIKYLRDVIAETFDIQTLNSQSHNNNERYYLKD